MQSFCNPVRLVWGFDALDDIAAHAKGIGISRALVVTDPVIGRTPFVAAALKRLGGAGLPLRVFAECGIDARLSHVERETAKVRADGTDGVIGFGGGSVLCTAKGIAVLANNGERLRRLEQAGNIGRRGLPMLLVPTTAGSGTEVSPYTIVKDDVGGGKFTFGNALCFPDLALLDPVVLETLPKRLAAVSAVDALTHAIEALFSKIATPVSDALALEAARLLFGSLEGSIVDGDPQCRLDNLLGASLANMACGQARLGLAHRLSRPLEDTFGLAHGIGVGTLMPRGLALCADQFPGKLARLAEAGIASGRSPGAMKQSLLERIFALYREIGFAETFDPAQVDRGRLREMAEMAVARTTDATERPVTISDDTPIVAANGTRATVAEAQGIYAACFA